MAKKKRSSKRRGRVPFIPGAVVVADPAVARAMFAQAPTLGEAVRIALSNPVRYARDNDALWSKATDRKAQADLDDWLLRELAIFLKQATAVLERLTEELQQTGNGKVALALRVEARKLVKTGEGMCLMRRTFAKIAARSPRESSGASVMIPYLERLGEIGYELAVTWDEIQPRSAARSKAGRTQSAGNHHPDSWATAESCLITLASLLSAINRSASPWRRKVRAAAPPTWRGPSASLYRVGDLIAAIESASPERFAKIAFPHVLSKKLWPADHEPAWASKATVTPPHFQRRSKSASKVRRK